MLWCGAKGKTRKLITAANIRVGLNLFYLFYSFFFFSEPFYTSKKLSTRVPCGHTEKSLKNVILHVMSALSNFLQKHHSNCSIREYKEKKKSVNIAKEKFTTFNFFTLASNHLEDKHASLLEIL